MKRLLSILLWSVVAAAFLGPGTITTAASAGASHGHALLWALAFSTVATLVLQEAAARLTVASGKDLGQALREQSRGTASGVLVLLLVLGAIVLGCAAYEAGNILGGVAGVALALPVSPQMLALATGALAALILAVGSPRQVARGLAVLVAVMGAGFLVTAAVLSPSWESLLTGTFVPYLPRGSGVLVLGLVGTTVVPYNLFLGSGLAAGQDLREMRLGLTVAVVLGGIISMGVLVVGSAVPGELSFEKLTQVLEDLLGGWARMGFAAGLFAAGLSSAVTAPLAAAITARGLFGEGPDDPRWSGRSWRFRAVWIGVLLVGVAFGVSRVRPVPAIVLAQALNGVLLPVVAVFLALAVNDRQLLGERGLNGAFANILLALVVAVSVVLGLTNLTKAGAAVTGLSVPEERTLLVLAAVVAAGLAVPVIRRARRRRRS